MTKEWVFTNHLELCLAEPIQVCSRLASDIRPMVFWTLRACSWMSAQRLQMSPHLLDPSMVVLLLLSKELTLVQRRLTTQFN
jgi:hypothetical protein